MAFVPFSLTSLAYVAGSVCLGIWKSGDRNTCLGPYFHSLNSDPIFMFFLLFYFVILLFLRNFKNLDIEVFRRESSQTTKIVVREKTQGKMYSKTVLLFYISPNISNLPCPQRWAVFIMKHNRSSKHTPLKGESGSPLLRDRGVNV